MAMDIEIRYFAAARAAAGANSVRVDSGTLESILKQQSAGNPELARVIAQCSFLVDSFVAEDLHQVIKAGSVIDVLPRFAGG